jgi:Cd2+/Zn2+-exporting ATPase
MSANHDHSSHDHPHDGPVAGHDHGHNHGNGGNWELVLTLVTIGGLAVALVDAYLQPLPSEVLNAALAAAYLAGGVPLLWRALVALVSKGRAEIDLLMALAALAALGVGAAMEGAVLLALFTLSNLLEHRAMGRAQKAVEGLMALRPETALRQSGAVVEEVPVEALIPGDLVVLRPGARVPVDGTLRAGTGEVDESTITGEAMPVIKAAGDLLHEATVNLNAVLLMEVRQGIASSTVARMIAMVTEAQAQKAPVERFSQWFGQRYTIAVLAGAVLAFAGFLAAGAEMSVALYKAATLLVAASPCAVVISVPAAILSALAAAARGGVLFKGGAALEHLAGVRAFAFDKTGTLTTGRAEVTGMRALKGGEDELLRLLAGIEAQSEHPIAGALRRAVAARGWQAEAVAGVVARPSEGLEAEAGLWAGNRRMVTRQGAEAGLAALAGLDGGAQTLVYLGRGPDLIGAVTVADLPRASSAEALQALRQGGIAEIVLMTGDRRPVAERIGAELGLVGSEIHADLLPADKVALVAALEAKGPVAYVGDGVNDAAALARASVGIAMGAAGSEVALQAADVALLSEDMAQLAAAHRLARRTLRVIQQNLAFALAAMALLVTGGLFFDLPLPLAVVGHEGGTLLVVLNGMRLLIDPIRRDR